MGGGLVQRSLLAALAGALGSSSAEAQRVSSSLSPDGSYTVSLLDAVTQSNITLTSLPLRVLYNGTYLSTALGSLVPSTGVVLSSGSDGIGGFSASTLSWSSPAVPGFAFSTSIRSYPGNDTLVFEQVFVSDVPALRPSPLEAFKTDSDVGPAANFPALAAHTGTPFGLLAYKGEFAGAGAEVTVWPGSTTHPVVGGLGNGPDVLVCASLGCHAVLSPLTHALTATIRLFTNGTLEAGVQDQAASIPPGYSFQTLLVGTGPGPSVPTTTTTTTTRTSTSAGDALLPAVASSMEAWGAAMLAYHGKARTPVDVHPVISSLGFCTNSYYFYCPIEKGVNSSVGDLSLMHTAVQAYAAAVGLPYAYHFLTSQWYGEHEYGGVYAWDDGGWGHMPDRFPMPTRGGEGGGGGGMARLWQTLKAQGVQGTSAHLGEWLASTPYAGNASWAWWRGPNSTTALPVDPSFWTQLFSRGAEEWGLLVVEQDHMNEQMGSAAPFTLGTVDGLEAWVGAEGEGALAAGVHLELCMESPAFILNSPTVQAVTHSRASGDYVPTQASWQWDIAVPSSLLWSLGLFPSKDTYYTNRAEVNARPHDPTTNDCMFAGFTEPHPDTHHIAAVLSTGVVQPSDGVGWADVPLILTSCRSDGVLLKPDRPLLRTEMWWRGALFDGQGAPSGALSSTFSVVSCVAWHYVFAVGLKAAYAVGPEDLFTPPACGGGVPPLDPPQLYALPFASAQPPYAWNVSARVAFGRASPVLLSPALGYAPQLRLVAPAIPLLGGGGGDALVLYGEVGKVSAVSSQRVTGMTRDGGDGTLTVTFTGSAGGEAVTLGYECVAVEGRGGGGGGHGGSAADATAPAAAGGTVTCVFPGTRSVTFNCTGGQGRATCGP